MRGDCTDLLICAAVPLCGFCQASINQPSAVPCLCPCPGPAQVAPASVAPRVLLFPWPLETVAKWEKISPGFFDAPGGGLHCDTILMYTPRDGAVQHYHTHAC